MPVHLLDDTPHRCEEEKLKDDRDEKEGRVSRETRKREREREYVYRIIKFHYRAVAIDCFRARANNHGTELMKLLSPLIAAISTLVFANEYTFTGRIRVLGTVTRLHNDSAN